MKELHELQGDRASKIKEQIELNKLAKKEDRSLTADETKTFDDIQAEIESLDGQIKRAKIMAENEKRMASLAGTPIGDPKPEKPEERFNFVDAIRNMVEGKPLSNKEREVKEHAEDELRVSGLSFTRPTGVSVPSTMMRAGQSVTDDAGAKGGALVGSDPRVVMPLVPELTIENLGATAWHGLNGDVPLPTNGLFSFGYVGETGAVTPTDVDFVGPTLKPKRLAGAALISRKLLLQSSIDVEAYIKKQLAQAINAAVLKNAISGAGGDAPNGLYNLITSNINITAGALTWDTIVNLESLIKSADSTEKALAYLSDPALMGSAKTIKKDAGSGIFLYDNNNMNGQKYIASSLIDTLDVGVSHPLIYGDWSQMFTGFWGGMNILVDPYTNSNSSQIKLNIELFNDVAVTNEKAFAINKVVTV